MDSRHPRRELRGLGGPAPKQGIQHLGVEVESTDDLSEVYARLRAADRPVLEEKRTTCCYEQL